MIRQLIVGALQVNCYLLADKDGTAVVVDPGGDGKRIVSTIGDLGLSVKAVINTHGHFDHIGANDIVAAEFGVPVMIHADDEEMLNQPKSSNPMFGDVQTYAGESPVEHMSDGDTLTFGGVSIDVRHTPGHTKGGVCLLVSIDGADAKDMITGDTLFAGSVGRTDLPGGDTNTLMASIKEQILSLGDDLAIHPGHGDSSSLAHEKMNNPYVMRLTLGDG